MRISFTPAQIRAYRQSELLHEELLYLLELAETHEELDQITHALALYATDHVAGYRALLAVSSTLMMHRAIDGTL